jgi:hypothetical protein
LIPVNHEPRKRAYAFRSGFDLHAEAAMRVSTTDPISGNDVKDLANAPFLIEGAGDGALKIFFESEDNKRAYLDIEVEHPGNDLSVSLDNPAPMGGERRGAP